MTNTLLMCVRADGDYWPLAARQLALPIGAAGEAFPYRSKYISASVADLPAVGLICLKFESKKPGRPPRFIPLRWLSDIRVKDSIGDHQFYSFKLGSTLDYRVIENREDAVEALKISRVYSARINKQFKKSLGAKESPEDILCTAIEMDELSLRRKVLAENDEISRWLKLTRVLASKIGDKDAFMQGERPICFTRLTRFNGAELEPFRMVDGEFHAAVGQRIGIEILSQFYSIGQEAERFTYSLNTLEEELKAAIRGVVITGGFNRQDLEMSPLVPLKRSIRMTAEFGSSVELKTAPFVNDILLPCNFKHDRHVYVDRASPPLIVVHPLSPEGRRFLSRPGHYVVCRDERDTTLEYVARLEPFSSEGAETRTDFQVRVLDAIKDGTAAMGLAKGNAPIISDVDLKPEYPVDQLTILLNGVSAVSKKRCCLLPLPPKAPAPLPEIWFPLRLEELRSTHTAIFGQTGSGKSYTLGVIVEEMLRSRFKVLVLDPNSDFIHFGTEHAKDSGEPQTTFDEWRKSFGDSAITVLTNRETNSKTPAGADKQWQLCQLKFSDFDTRQLAALVGLSRDEVEMYAEHRKVIKQLKSDPGAFSPKRVVEYLRVHAESGGQSIRSRLAEMYENQDVTEELNVDQRERIWVDCEDVKGNAVKSVHEHIGEFVRSNDQRMLAVDLGAIESHQAKLLVAGEVLKELRNIALKNGGLRENLYVLLDEAHNLAPPESGNELQRVSTEYVNWIAGEGRKYGLNLVLVTQKPSKIHPNALGMVSNLICMRVTNREDLKTIETVFGDVPKFLLDQVPNLPKGAAIVSGKIVPIPLVLQFDFRMTSEGIKAP